MTKNYFDTYKYLQTIKPKDLDYTRLLDSAPHKQALYLNSLSTNSFITSLWLDVKDYANIKVSNNANMEVLTDFLLLNRVYKKSGLYFCTPLYSFGNKDMPLPFEMYFYLNISNGDLFKPLKAFGFGDDATKASYNELMDLATLVITIGNIQSFNKEEIPSTYGDFLGTTLFVYEEMRETTERAYNNLKEEKAKETNEQANIYKDFSLSMLRSHIEFLAMIKEEIRTRQIELSEKKEDELTKEALYPKFIENFFHRDIKETYVLSRERAFEIKEQGQAKGYRIAHQSKIEQIALTIKKYSNTPSLLREDEGTLNALDNIQKSINQINADSLNLPVGSKERELLEKERSAKTKILINYANQSQIIVYNGVYYKNTNKNVRVYGAVGNENTFCLLEIATNDGTKLSLRTYLKDVMDTFYKANSKAQNDLIYKTVLLYTLSKIAHAHSKRDYLQKQTIPTLYFTGDEMFKAVTGKTYESELKKANIKGNNAIKTLKCAKQRSKQQFINALMFLQHSTLILGTHGEMNILQGYLDIDIEKNKGKEFNDIDGNIINNGVAIIPSNSLWDSNVYGLDNKSYGNYFYVKNLDKTESIEEQLLALCFCLAESHGIGTGKKKKEIQTYKFTKICEYLCIEPPTLANKEDSKAKKDFHKELSEKRNRIKPYLFHLKEIKAVSFKEADFDKAGKAENYEFTYAMPIAVNYDEEEEEKKDLKKLKG